MNLFEKIQAIRVELREQNLKPTGKNEFAKYSYFELDDFLPQLNRLMKQYNMTAIASFTIETASLTAINIEAPEERFVITSPFSSASLKGCHEVQCVGAVETYQRRYLYQALFDIGEKDGLDSTFNPTELKTQQSRGKTQPQQNKPQSANNGVTNENPDWIDMTLEEARNYKVTFGKMKDIPFKDIPEYYLEWLVENAKVPQTKKAAELVLQSIRGIKKVASTASSGSQLEIVPLSQEEQNDLPF